jgi:hypothetical protein
MVGKPAAQGKSQGTNHWFPVMSHLDMAFILRLHCAAPRATARPQVRERRRYMFVTAARATSAAAWAAMVLAGRHTEAFWMRQLATSVAARLVTALFKQMCRPVRSARSCSARTCVGEGYCPSLSFALDDQRHLSWAFFGWLGLCVLCMSLFLCFFLESCVAATLKFVGDA